MALRLASKIRCTVVQSVSIHPPRPPALPQPSQPPVEPLPRRQGGTISRPVNTTAAAPAAAEPPRRGGRPPDGAAALQRLPGPEARRERDHGQAADGQSPAPALQAARLLPTGDRRPARDVPHQEHAGPRRGAPVPEAEASPEAAGSPRN